jgi:phosphoribosylformimino-5-aminoimidazole carboxamide ribotide isomerase
MGGRLARALEGEIAEETVYRDDPVAAAADLVRQGATWLHVVDMDRATGTGRENSDMVSRVAAIDGVEIQLGGNVDSALWVRESLEAGVSRIVLGTSVALEAALFEDLVHEAGAERCALAIDTRSGVAALRGSSELVGLTVEQLVDRAMSLDVMTVVFRDIVRDGTGQGADIDRAARVAELGASVIVAGGVAGLDDIRAAREAGLAGVIVGRALHEGRFTLWEAMLCSS